MVSCRRCNVPELLATVDLRHRWACEEDHHFGQRHRRRRGCDAWLFGGGIASATTDVVGMTYGDAVSKIEDGGGTAKIAVTVGDRQAAMGDCLVTAATDAPFVRDDAGFVSRAADARSCSALTATAGPRRPPRRAPRWAARRAGRSRPRRRSRRQKQRAGRPSSRPPARRRVTRRPKSRPGRNAA